MQRLKVIALATTILIICCMGQTGFGAERFVLKAGCDQPIGEHVHYVALARMAERLEKRSQGRIKIDIYPGSQLGSETEMLEALGMGAQDLVTSSFGNAGTFIPEYGFFSVSYLFQSFDHLRNVLYSGPEFLEKLQKITDSKPLNLKLLAVTSVGARYMYCRTRPVKTLSDLKGIKMRVMSSPIESKNWSLLGTMPASIPQAEIYTALQTGVVDAAESSAQVIFAKKFYEVAPYICLTQHQFGISGIFMSKLTFDKLPADLREMVIQVAAEVAKECFDLSERNDKVYIEKLSQQPHVQIVDVQRGELAKRVAPLQDEVAKQLGAEDFLSLIRKAAK